MMPQNTEYSQLPHLEVSANLKLRLEVDLRLTKQTLPKEYLIPTGIAYHLNGGSTRG